ncbi:hypothetical protein [Sphingomonas sp. UYP23]
MADVDQYFYELGRFANRFAEIEALLRLQCAVVAEVPDELTGIIFGEVTAGSGGEILKRLRSAKGLDADPDLSRALLQLTRIAQTRNAVLHRGVTFGEAAFATKPGLPNSRRQQYPVSAEILRAMSVDLNVISAAMIVAVPIDEPSFLIWADGVRAAAQTPWQYMHEPLPMPKDDNSDHQ